MTWELFQTIHCNRCQCGCRPCLHVPSLCEYHRTVCVCTPRVSATNWTLKMRSWGVLGPGTGRHWDNRDHWHWPGTGAGAELATLTTCHTANIYADLHRSTHAAHFVILVIYLKQVNTGNVYCSPPLRRTCRAFCHTRHLSETGNTFCQTCHSSHVILPAIQAAENIPTLIACFTVNNGVLNVNAEKLKFLKRAEKDLGLKLFDKCFSYLTNWAWDIIST